jgi:hypothetical protein
MSKKSSKKFDLAESLKGESDVHAVDSDAIGTPRPTGALSREIRSLVVFSHACRTKHKWCAFTRAPHAARSPEWLYFVTWSQFSKEWDCYLWEDALIASTPDVCTAMLAKQRPRSLPSLVAVARESGAPPRPKPPTMPTPTKIITISKRPTHSPPPVLRSATAANNKRDRATDELLRAPILPVINELPISVQMRNRRARQRCWRRLRAAGCVDHADRNARRARRRS